MALPDRKRGKQIVRARVTSEKSCLDLARERVAACFEDFDKVVVMFSGGKDSTAVLNLAAEEAARQGRLPLDVATFDEEAIPPETVEYMTRVAARPDLRFVWNCLPIKSSNACSRTSPHWYPWAAEDAAKWCRPLPPGAVTEAMLPGFKRGMHLPDVVPLLYGPENGTVCQLMGIRCQESMSRYRAIVVKAGDDAYRTVTEGVKWLTKAYPIYDWMTEDVWRAPHALGWDYNHAYDTMERCGLVRPQQRCSPPFAAQPLRRLHTFKVCWPDLWAKMVDRVPGVATAARYANTELYGFAVTDDDLPDGMTWEAYSKQLLNDLAPDMRAECALALRVCIRCHALLTKDPVPDGEPHPVSGFCWKMLCVIPTTGNNKFDRQQQKVWNMAKSARERMAREKLKAAGGTAP